MRRRRKKSERPGRACECGNAKAAGAYACDRCRRLEGAGYSADTRGRARIVGVRERAVYGLVVVDRACDAWLRERGLIDRDRWRGSNEYLWKGAGPFPRDEIA